ncbi:hypothetical protein [Halapricum sp. CBA1109]|nr:hypothetical protein [Halapricum sp. CBA1109]
MSILDRLFGTESRDESCCDMQIEEVDDGDDSADGPIDETGD